MGVNRKRMVLSCALENAARMDECGRTGCFSQAAWGRRGRRNFIEQEEEKRLIATQDGRMSFISS